MLSSCVRPSVRPSATSRHCTKTAERRIMQTTPYDSPGTLVFWCQRSRRNSNGVIPNGGANRGGVGSDQWFSTSISLPRRNDARQRHSYYRRLTVTRVCSIEWCYFHWPWMTPKYPKPLHFPHFVFFFISSKWVEIETSHLLGEMIVASLIPQMTNRHWKGRGQVTWTI